MYQFVYYLLRTYYEPDFRYWSIVRCEMENIPTLSKQIPLGNHTKLKKNIYVEILYRMT